MYFFINNHTPLLGYRISIILIRFPTIRYNLIDKSENVDLSIRRLSMTSLSGPMIPFDKNILIDQKLGKNIGGGGVGGGEL